MPKVRLFLFPAGSMLIIMSILYLVIMITACDSTVVSDNVIARKGIPMSAAQENQTPAVNSAGTGTIDVSYDRVTRKMSYTISWNNLTSDSVTGSHIHGTATRTQNAPVVHPFTIPASRNGTYSGVADVDGVKIKEDSLLAGFYYFNIHTNRYKGGEIRGQIVF